MSDDRTAGQQLRDLTGLFTGRTKIQDGRIVPKNPPPPSDETSNNAVNVDVDVDVER